MTKWPVQKPTHRTTQKHAEHQDAADIQKTPIFVFFGKQTIKNLHTKYVVLISSKYVFVIRN